MLEELCKRIQHCCATLRRSRNKRNVGSCWLKSLTGFKLCATTRNNIQQLQQGVQTDATCNIKQCWELLVNNVASVCTGLKMPVGELSHSNDTWSYQGPSVFSCVFPRVVMTAFIALNSDWFLEFSEFAVHGRSGKFSFRLVFRDLASVLDIRRSVILTMEATQRINESRSL